MNKYLSGLMALAVTTSLSFTSAVSADDFSDSEEFVKKASIAGKFEIESSKIALEKAQDAEVKKFAEQMIADHTKADAELKATLKSTKVNPSFATSALDDKHQGILKDLREASKEDFDEDYIDAQVKAHDEAVSLFEDYSEDGEDKELKAFATKTLPTLKQHQEHVDGLDDER